MLLCDALVEAAVRWNEPEWTAAVLRLFGPDAWQAKYEQYVFLAERVQRAVRYVLDDRVMANACAAIGAKPTTLESCLEVLRCPHDLTWIEWREPVRIQVREAFGWIGENNGLPVPERMGVLVEAMPGGRRGFCAYAWQHANVGMPAVAKAPEVCPLAVAFDFDDPAITTGCRPAALEEIAVFERRWYADPREKAASERTDRLARSIVPRFCRHYVEAFGALAEQVEHLPEGGGHAFIIDRAQNDIAGEFKQVISTLLMLTARNSVETIDHAYGRLNAKRAKRGKPALLDHKIVTMRISGLEKRRSGAGSGINGRASPHAHLVQGHYVVRKVPKQKIYYRRGHQRGSGIVPLKTVHVLP